ncbi:hydantoinase/oxoprolinase family protein [Marinihelvus fidelis]|uniref:Hydantoinase/oxoprolinase family protein n=2 Tax=Marinihelvus fidelis TaxID=2613842 RepID=A0A5N0T9K7_9GAMM|nr:hydantoinase/oxoprolinase family protein [Marinihelvus fidelis]
MVGVDTGGTFTDFVALVDGQLRHCKVLSTPDDPSRAIVEGIDRLGLADRDIDIVHGTTVGTNAVLEGKGARVAYVTSAGFADVLTLGRQERDHVYRLEQPAMAPPVPRERCFEVSTRIDADGELIARADDDELAALAASIAAAEVDAVAVNLLFSFLRPEEEQRIAEALGERWFVSLSSEVLPEAREYERGVATWLNAGVGPLIGRYLRSLAARLPRARIAVMQSAGTTVAAATAAGHAVRLLLSGPAGGIAAAEQLGRAIGAKRLLTFDMGGTSTDVALVDGGIPLTTTSRMGRWPLTIPTVDIHTIGAGGGSIARVDAGGMLLVGPESAGADPGPACYGRGGEQVTVTDANLVLGRIPAGTKLGGYLALDRAAADAAMARLADAMDCDAQQAARGVIRIANEHMARALRVISVERGHDPREDALFCFGGAGGLHACELANLLGMRRVVLPRRAGVLSAQGMLASAPGRDAVEAILAPLADWSDTTIGGRFAALSDALADELAAEGHVRADLSFTHQLELRYHGQDAGIMLPFELGADHAEAFAARHEAASGYRLERPVELANLRLAARATAPMPTLPTEPPPARGLDAPERNTDVPVITRAELEQATAPPIDGPAIITDTVGTAWIPSDWQATADPLGNLVVTRNA